MKRTFILGILLFQILAMFSQKNIMLYQKEGVTTLFLNEIDSISYTSVNNVIKQEIFTTDSIYEFDIESVDSICFVAPSIIERDNVFNLSNNLIQYVDGVEYGAESHLVLLNSSTPKDLVPKMSDYLYQLEPTKNLPYGFCGRVCDIKESDLGYSILCDHAELSDMFERFVWSREIEMTSQDEDYVSSKFGASDDNQFKFYSLPYLSTTVKYPDVIAGGISMTDELRDIPLGPEEPQITGKIAVKPTIRCATNYTIMTYNGVPINQRRLYIQAEAKIKGSISGRGKAPIDRVSTVSSHEPIKVNFPIGLGERLQLSYSGSMSVSGDTGIDYSFESDRASSISSKIFYDENNFPHMNVDLKMDDAKSQFRRDVDVSTQRSISINSTLSFSVGQEGEPLKSIGASFSYGENLTGYSDYKKSQLTAELSDDGLYGKLVETGVQAVSPHAISGSFKYGDNTFSKRASSDNVNAETYYIVPKLSNVNYNKSEKTISYDVEGLPMKSCQSRLGIAIAKDNGYVPYSGSAVWTPNLSKFVFSIPKEYNKRDLIYPTVSLPAPVSHSILAHPSYKYQIAEEDLIGYWERVMGAGDFTNLRINSNYTGACIWNSGESHSFNWSLLGNRLVLDFYSGGMIYEQQDGTVELDGDYVNYDFISHSVAGTGGGSVRLKFISR
ncbi:MAG: hypothetical protein NC102_05820 [Clostridium sp.]|nr:hypothetical protein [Clostridium sp.]